MESFAGLVMRASQAMGAPFYLASQLSVAPYDVYRWIAGTELRKKHYQRDVERRLLILLKDRADARRIGHRGIDNRK